MQLLTGDGCGGKNASLCGAVRVATPPSSPPSTCSKMSVPPMVVALGTIASSPRFFSFVVKAGAGSCIEGIASSAGVANVVDVNVNVGVGAGAGTGAGGDAERDLAAVDIARGVANVGVDVEVAAVITSRCVVTDGLFSAVVTNVVHLGNAAPPPSLSPPTTPLAAVLAPLFLLLNSSFASSNRACRL